MVEIHLKPDWMLCQECLDSHHIDRLFHFTDRANIASIRENGGLMSWRESQRRGIEIPRPGGNDYSRELDVSRGLDDYVRLTFVPDPPMLFALRRDGRLLEPVTLEIHPIVALWQTTLFCTGNAASFKNQVRVGCQYDVLKDIRFDLINRGRWDDDAEKLLYQAELLVHSFLPIEYIVKGV